MISICCCAINAKYDVEAFVGLLHIQNPDVDFEVCLTHDDRVDDGSKEYFELLQKKYSKLRITRSTYQDHVEYLERLFEYYERNNIFSPGLRSDLYKNVCRVRDRNLPGLHRRGFVWLTSGVLYNKAVSMSRGDTLVITPADFVYLFGLGRLERHVEQNKRDGCFYGKPNAVFARVTNQDHPWLRQHVQNVHDGIGHREGYRWDSTSLFRDFLKCPPRLDELYVPDFRNNCLIRLADPASLDLLKRFSEESIRLGGVQCLPGFHGFHVMTRRAYDLIGGFTEEYFGRAFADDKMSVCGRKFLPGGALPEEFSVAWCGQYEVLPHHAQGYADGWRERLSQVDPFYGKHPIPAMVSGSDPGVFYLEDGIMPSGKFNQTCGAAFNRDLPPIRILR
jgi:hypothetical protein